MAHAKDGRIVVLAELYLLALAGGLLWMWLSWRRRVRELSEPMQPGERWQLVEQRTFSGGTSWLVYSAAYEQWGAYTTWEDGRKPEIAWRTSEALARETWEAKG